MPSLACHQRYWRCPSIIPLDNFLISIAVVDEILISGRATELNVMLHMDYPVCSSHDLVLFEKRHIDLLVWYRYRQCLRK